MTRQSGYTIMELLAVALFLAGCAGVILAIYATVHFILKFW